MKEIKVKADKEAIDEVYSFIEEELLSVEGCSRRDALKLHMVIDELFTNVANYAYENSEGEVTVGFDEENSLVSISFIDSGTPYNPLDQESPDVTLSAKERKIGGLGVFMVKNTVDDISYERKDGKNIVTVYKKVGGQL